jgi:hypothetical protein
MKTRNQSTRNNINNDKSSDADYYSSNSNDEIVHRRRYNTPRRIVDYSESSDNASEYSTGSSDNDSQYSDNASEYSTGSSDNASEYSTGSSDNASESSDNASESSDNASESSYNASESSDSDPDYSPSSEDELDELDELRFEKLTLLYGALHRKMYDLNINDNDLNELSYIMNEINEMESSW